MRKILLLVIFCFLICNVAFPATKKKKIIPPIEKIEWWKTFEECVNATGYVNYVPRTTALSPPPLGLILAGLPHRACVKTNLPEIEVDSAWVRQSEGDHYFFKKEEYGTLTPVVMAKCLNKVQEFVYLPDRVVILQGPKGDKGDKGDSVTGPKGDKGDSVTGAQGTPGTPGKDAEVSHRKSHKKLIAGIVVAGVTAAILGTVFGRGGGAGPTKTGLAAGSGINP